MKIIVFIGIILTLILSFSASYPTGSNNNIFDDSYFWLLILFFVLIFTEYLILKKVRLKDMGTPRTYPKSTYSDNEIKPSIETRIEKLLKNEKDTYLSTLYSRKKYNIPSGFTNFVSNIIASCRGGYI